MTFKSGHLEIEENYNRVIGPDYGLKRLNNPAPIRYVTGLLTGLLCINLPRVAGFRRARACRSRYKNRPSPGNLKFQARKSAKPTRMGWGGQKLGPLPAARWLAVRERRERVIQKKKSCPPMDGGDVRNRSELLNYRRSFEESDQARFGTTSDRL